MRVRLHEGARALAALEPAWWELWRAAPATTPFQSPAWLVPWAQAIGGDRTLAVSGWRDGQLVLLLPLLALDDLAGRRLMLLGVGTTDHLDMLGEAEAALEALRAHPALGQGLDLTRLPPGGWLATVRPPGWSAPPPEPDDPAPALDLSAGPDLGRLLPDSMAQNVRTARNRASRAGAWAVERAGDVGRALDELVALHRARWASQGRPGVLADPEVRRFHALALPRLEAAGLLRLYRVTLNGRTLAVHYGLSDGRAGYYYLGGFDPAEAALSPGTLAVAHAVEDAAREGCRVFDFLRGREPYKYRWGAVDRPAVRRRLTPL